MLTLSVISLKRSSSDEALRFSPSTLPMSSKILEISSALTRSPKTAEKSKFSISSLKFASAKSSFTFKSLTEKWRKSPSSLFLSAEISNTSSPTVRRTETSKSKVFISTIASIVAPKLKSSPLTEREAFAETFEEFIKAFKSISVGVACCGAEPCVCSFELESLTPKKVIYVKKAQRTIIIYNDIALNNFDRKFRSFRSKFRITHHL